MADKIYRGNSFHKEILLTKTDEFGNEEPLDLEKYNDNYLAIKKNRNAEDSESYIIKEVFPDTKQKGLINIYLSPEETSQLPLTTNEPIYMFVQLGSTATGEVNEIGSYKIKTINAGIKHISQVVRELGDCGSIANTAYFTFDCGHISNRPLLVYDCGGSPVENFGYIGDLMYEIDDYGYIGDTADKQIDRGEIRK